MKIIRLGLGAFEVNCYILLEPDSKEAIVIDPSVNSLEITSLLKGYLLKYIVNTHGHFDHIGGNTLLTNGTGAKLIIHEKDAPMLQDPQLNLSTLFSMNVVSRPADILINSEQQTILLGKYEFNILFVPGHTPGSMALYNPERKVLFSGDFIFSETVGRVDLPGGNMEQMKNSIQRIISLPDDVTVYPGHEEPFLLANFKSVHKIFLESEEL